jgi:hypothetical protein
MSYKRYCVALAIVWFPAVVLNPPMKDCPAAKAFAAPIPGRIDFAFPIESN